jgi:hypothetical protein
LARAPTGYPKLAHEEEAGTAMNQQRFQELVRKGDGTGLTDDEADELGRMIAERDGKPYANASDIHPDGPRQDGVTAAEEVEAAEREEAGEEATPEPPLEEQEEDRAAGMEERGGQRYS